MKATILTLALATAAAAQEAPARPPVDVVFLVDCSGSMGQVIESAKQKVWSIANEIAKARPTPRLRIGLVAYGSSDKWTRTFDLSDDLDKVYENLMTFKVEADGNEWVGWAIHHATTTMSWTKDAGALKVIFVLGNETARQGPPEFDYSVTAPAAIKQDIVVNAIYCGSAGGEETWAEFARLAEGEYAAIDISGGVVAIAAPQDKEMVALNEKLNGTYIAYGKRGKEAKENQVRQDANATQAGGSRVLAERAACKSDGLYRNESWDLVDACKQKEFKLENLKDEELPENMRKMSPAERKAFVASNAAEREKISAQIQELAKARQTFIDAEIKKQNLNASGAFDQVIQKTIRAQAEKKNFTFK
jgi:hypothetical protein